MPQWRHVHNDVAGAPATDDDGPLAFSSGPELAHDGGGAHDMFAEPSGGDESGAVKPW